MELVAEEELHETSCYWRSHAEQDGDIADVAEIA